MAGTRGRDGASVIGGARCRRHVGHQLQPIRLHPGQQRASVGRDPSLEHKQAKTRTLEAFCTLFIDLEFPGFRGQ
jgi:hypothetical protein